MAQKIKVLIVDDSAVIREVFTELLSSDPSIIVIGTATDPYDAREKIKKLLPDVITLDIEMPHMDGISFLEKIMMLRPMPVIMASTLTQKGAEATIRALELGAVDYISKPVHEQSPETLAKLKSELIVKVKIAASAKIQSRTVTAPTNILPFTPNLKSSQKIIAIGSSTGGVEALRELLVRIPANCPPIIITQHMPEHFTESFAKRLNTLCQPTVQEITNNQQIFPGNIYIAPGGLQFELVRSSSKLICKLYHGETVSGHCPSVDVMFGSVASIMKDKAIGVILTGMGKDGANGLLQMRQAGAYTIGQNEETCIVYGMPKVAKQLGAVIIEKPLSQIAEEILKQCTK